MDDFSFPTLIPDTDSPPDLPYPHFASSPLWFPSSAAVESAAEPSSSGSSGDPSGEDGEKTSSEKMDQLWEEFNEELAWLSLTQTEAEKQSTPLFLLVHTKQRKDGRKGKKGRGVLGSESGGSSFRHQNAAVVAALKVMKKVISIPKH